MKIVFIGSSAYGVPALNMLCQKGLRPILVVSQPAKPAGRNLHPQPTPISEIAKQHNLPLFTPLDINEPDSIVTLAACEPDILITASYGGFLGKQLRFLAPYKAINLHPSLLPKYRGASPIQSAILHGDTVTGNTIFRLVAEMDAGPIIAQQNLPIEENENYSCLHQRLALQAASMLKNLLQSSEKPFPEIAQEREQATWCPLIDSSLCLIDWYLPAKTVQNKIRAFSETPGAWVYFRGSKLKILGANLTDLPAQGEPGQIVSTHKNTGFTVNCLDKQIQLTQVQAAGKKSMEATSFANGARLVSGEKLWM